jgi:hypothetical protein
MAPPAFLAPAGMNQTQPNSAQIVDRAPYPGTPMAAIVSGMRIRDPAPAAAEESRLDWIPSRRWR